MVHAQRVLVLRGLGRSPLQGGMTAGGEQAVNQARCESAAQDLSGPFLEPPDALESPEEDFVSPDFSCLAFSL